ncbi:PREDICTED: protein ENL-like [Nicotiana attenuata]|uniref:protein ENL-like n=1 Tax=Nicotiana attenuata TaxID=49451 RepID=UPI000904D12C|nr:PREDICTED: protein ENL-like [Nicotiana attenuata]
MTNPQDNPGTPPPVSPNTSSSTPPVENPKPRFHRQKMLARKTSSQKKAGPAAETNSSSESDDYISTSEGDEPGSSEQAKTQESQREVKSCYVFSDVVDREENRFVLIGAARDVGGTDSGKMRKKKKKEPLAICGGGEEGVSKSGGSGSGEAAEGLINLSKQQDEPGSSDEESLANLLKKVGANYGLKKRKASSQKTPAASKPTKKSKQSPPKSTPRIRATRSTGLEGHGSSYG